MLRKPEGSVNHLQVPKPRRACSFIDNINHVDERIASNLSLPTGTNSILKHTNSSRQRQSSCARLNVHYIPPANEVEEKLNLISTRNIPIDSSSLMDDSLSNSHIPNRYFLSLKMVSQRRLRSLIERPSLSNPFLHGRYEKQ
jgi:hypothetical protein